MQHTGLFQVVPVVLVPSIWISFLMLLSLASPDCTCADPPLARAKDGLLPQRLWQFIHTRPKITRGIMGMKQNS